MRGTTNLDELRTVIPQALEAIQLEIALEDQVIQRKGCTRKHQRLAARRAQSDAMEAKLEAIARAALSRKPRTWADLALIGILVRHWADENSNGQLLLSASDWIGDRLLAALIDGAAAMGQTPPESDGVLNFNARGRIAGRE
jgi:hypothetical protein